MRERCKGRKAVVGDAEVSLVADDEQSMKERLAAVKFRDDGALTLHLELIELAGEDHQTSETPSARSRSRRSS